MPMTGDTIAWVTILGAGVGGAACLFYLLRKISKPLIRNIIIGFVLAFFLIPAPLPGYPDEWAPAFVVLIFEAFFQIDGEPGVSLRLLLIGTLLITALIGLAHYLHFKFAPKPAEAVPED
jgi:hypothetical protein